MITQLILDWSGYTAGTPAQLVDLGSEWVTVEMPDGKQIHLEAEAVSSGIHSPEETLPELERLTGVAQNTLLVAIRDGRLMARKSGSTWLTTANAVEYAIAKGKIRSGIAG